MPFDREKRTQELRDADPSGFMSNSDIERRVDLEELQYDIDQLFDYPISDTMSGLRSILTRIAEKL